MRNQVLNYAIKALKKTKKKGIDFDIYALFSCNLVVAFFANDSTLDKSILARVASNARDCEASLLPKNHFNDVNKKRKP